MSFACCTAAVCSSCLDIQSAVVHLETYHCPWMLSPVGSNIQCLLQYILRIECICTLPAGILWTMWIFCCSCLTARSGRKSQEKETQTTGANTLLAPAPKTRGLERAMSTAAVKAAMVIMETIATTAVCSGHQAIQPAKHQEPLLSPG